MKILSRILQAIMILGFGCSCVMLMIENREVRAQNAAIKTQGVTLACEAFCLNHSEYSPPENAMIVSHPQDGLDLCYCLMPDETFEPFALKPLNWKTNEQQEDLQAAHPEER